MHAFGGGAGKSSGAKSRALLLVRRSSTMELRTLATETKKTSAPILVGARGLSDPVSPGGRRFSFVIPDAATESGYRSVADVMLPEQGSDFIILLEPSGENFKAHVVIGKEPRFVNGSTLFFNATDIPIGATLGETKILIRPGDPILAEAPPKGERPWYQVSFYEPDVDGSPRIFTNTRWPYRNASRSYVFFFLVKDSERIAIQAVDESLVSPEE